MFDLTYEGLLLCSCTICRTYKIFKYFLWKITNLLLFCSCLCYKQYDKHVFEIFQKYDYSQAHLLKTKPGYKFQESET